jgi:hypothetical protein
LFAESPDGQDRAHGIGQTKPVLLWAHTIETKIATEQRKLEALVIVPFVGQSSNDLHAGKPAAIASAAGGSSSKRIRIRLYHPPLWKETRASTGRF